MVQDQSWWKLYSPIAGFSARRGSNFADGITPLVEHDTVTGEGRGNAGGEKSRWWGKGT